MSSHLYYLSCYCWHAIYFRTELIADPTDDGSVRMASVRMTADWSLVVQRRPTAVLMALSASRLQVFRRDGYMSVPTGPILHPAYNFSVST